MRRHARSISAILLWLAVGAVFGPVAIAGGAAAFRGSRPDAMGRASEVEKLVDAYRDRLPRHVLFLTLVPPPDGEECGYDPETLFPDRVQAMHPQGRTDVYADHQGYRELDRWRSRRRDEAWIRAITAAIHNRMSEFQIGFLRRCIQSTLFAGLCAKEVERIGDTVPRYGRPRINEAQGFEDRVVCTFADGVAARRGVALAPADRIFADE
jgi:hypothetical protein